MIKSGGVRLIDLYNGSLSKLLSSVYPEYDWLPWKFTVCPLGFWNDIANQRKFTEWVAKELNIKEMEDWYRVTTKVNT